jgi:renalase
VRVVVIGAGLSGVTAARELQRNNCEVIVLDKGRSPGGRMATRRDGDARFDHGAQFFTVRDELFQHQVGTWQSQGLVHEWCRGFNDIDGHPRYVASQGMNTLVKDLATQLDVRCGVTVSAVKRQSTQWVIESQEEDEVTCDRVIITSPIPQTNALLASTDVVLPDDIASCAYDATIALLAVVEESLPTLGECGGLQNLDDVFSFIADNSKKGVSPVPAVTFHANPAWSSEHFEQSDEWLHDHLLSLASPWLGDVSVVSSQVKKWRYATPRVIWPHRFWLSNDHSVCLAGDAFGGPKVEGAYLSGHFAAGALTSR